MGESIYCQICEKLATVHLTQIINNKIHKVHLCEDCAQAKGITDPEGFSLEDLFSKSGLIAEIDTTESDLVCAECGFSTGDFKRYGRLGCPSCYTQLSGVFLPMLKNMHKGERHCGKIPHRALKRVALHNQLSALDSDLQLAIKDERYEEAARFRDEISRLKEAISEKTRASPCL